MNATRRKSPESDIKGVLMYIKDPLTTTVHEGCTDSGKIKEYSCSFRMYSSKVSTKVSELSIWNLLFKTRRVL